jgi:hypothetical protein
MIALDSKGNGKTAGGKLRRKETQLMEKDHRIEEEKQDESSCQIYRDTKEAIEEDLNKCFADEL